MRNSDGGQKRQILLVAAVLPALFAPPALGESNRIFGTLLGADEQPMIRAHVHLKHPGPQGDTIYSVEVAKNGAYELSAETQGLFEVVFTGVFHQALTVPMLFNRPRSMRLDVVLKAPAYRQDFSKVGLTSNSPKAPIRGKKLLQQPDGAWAVMFDSTVSALYALTGVVASDQPINGTRSDDYQYSGSGFYYSIVAPINGKVTIAFDPSNLVRLNRRSKVRFGDSDSRVPQFYQIYQEMEDRVEAQRIAERKARDVHERAGKLPSDFRLQPIPPSADEIASCVKRIAEQSDLLIRQMLWLNYLDLTVANRNSDHAMVTKALKTLTPLSMVWALRPQLADLAVNASSSSKKFRDYVTAMVLNLPTPDIQAKVLWRLAMAADEAKQTNKRDRYTELLQERFPDHPSTKVVASFFGKDRKVMAGKTVPPFSAPSFDDPNVIYTNKNLNAKVYMIDFWATWCGPCIGEMPYLHRAYERYKGKGFQILSYSLDSVRELVVKFHAEKWKMPWLNAIDPELRAFDSDIAKAFDLYGIPTAILVDPGTNKIIAVNEEIRGEKLDGVLAEVFKELAP